MADPNPERGGTSNPTPLWHWLYLPWVWLVFLPLMLVLTLFWTSAAWFLGHFHADWAYGCAKPWARMLCLSNFTWVRLRGKENIQPGQKVLINGASGGATSTFSLWPPDIRCPIVGS